MYKGKHRYGEDVVAIVAYFVRFLIYLQALGITCVVVLDGGTNAAKGPERALRRGECQPPPHVPTAAERSQAEELCLQEAPSSVGGTHDSASEQGPSAEDEDFVHGRLHEALKCELARRGFRYLVSPMEADSQMAFLLIMSYVQILITDDSDLPAHLASHPHARVLMSMSADWKEAYDVRVGDLFLPNADNHGDPLLQFLAGKDWRALHAYAYVAHTDYNHLYGVGQTAAIGIVQDVWNNLRFAEHPPDGVPGSDSLLSSALMELASRALVVHQAYAASHPPKNNGSKRLPRILGFDAVYQGVIVAFTAFTRALAGYDPSRLAEVRPVLLRLMIYTYYRLNNNNNNGPYCTQQQILLLKD